MTSSGTSVSAISAAAAKAARARTDNHLRTNITILVELLIERRVSCPWGNQYLNISSCDRGNVTGNRGTKCIVFGYCRQNPTHNTEDPTPSTSPDKQTSRPWYASAVHRSVEPERRLLTPVCLQPSQKTFRTKRTLAKAARQNRWDMTLRFEARTRRLIRI
jgi:hypothetical protein